MKDKDDKDDSKANQEARNKSDQARIEEGKQKPRKMVWKALADEGVIVEG